MIGFLGFAKLDDIYLLTQSCDINRMVNPLISEAVWGAGWHNAAKTNYADNQQHFEGGLTYELQGISSVWNLTRDWLIEERVTPKSLIYSPNAVNVYSSIYDAEDCRSGAWCKSASFTIDANAIVTVNTNVITLQRTETLSANSYQDIRIGEGIPTGPLNPTPRNLNPIPGWSCRAEITWPNIEAMYDTGVCDGLVMQTANLQFENNTQIVKGCTGQINPVAVMQGRQDVTGSIQLWRDGSIADPYAVQDQFTSEESSLTLFIGINDYVSITIPHLLLTSDSFPVGGPNNLVMRTFNFEGLGDGTDAPMSMSVAS